MASRRRGAIQCSAASAARISHDPTPPARGFGNVLVCLDGSATAEAAIPLAARLARLDEGRVTLLSVLDAPAEPSAMRIHDAVAWEVTRGEARAYLERVRASMGDLGVPTEVHVAEGVAAQRVAALAGELAADLVVLSTHGRGEVDGFPFGGTAQKILAVVSLPLLVVPARREVRCHTSAVPPQRIFVPLDGSLRGECALPTAVRIARAADAEIIVGHVVAEPIRTEVLSTEGDLALAGEIADRLLSRARDYLAQVTRRLANDGVRARMHVIRSTDQREGLVALSTTERADLVIVSAHGAGCNARRRFGSATAHYLAHSRCPLLVVPDLCQGHDAALARGSFRLPPRSRDVVVGGS